jgi:lactam utilization protein B
MVESRNCTGSNPALANFRNICVHSDTRDAHEVMKSFKDVLKSLGYETPKNTPFSQNC